MRFVTFAAAILLSAPAAFAQAPAAPAAAKTTVTAGPIKLGTYDIELAIGGGTLAGTLELKQAGDGMSALIRVGDHNPPPIKSMARTGSQLDITAGDEGTNVVYKLTFAGDAVSGTFTFNGDPGLVSGKLHK